MQRYLVSYDLLKAGQDYARLYSGFRGVDPRAARLLESVWVVETSLTASDLRDRLKSYIDANDRLVVFASENDWATWNARADGLNHLKGLKAA